MPARYFLYSPSRNSPFQPIDSQLTFDLSPFPAFGGPKYRRSKETPPERVPLRKLLTKTPFPFLPLPLQGGGRGGGGFCPKTLRSQGVKGESLHVLHISVEINNSSEPRSLWRRPPCTPYSIEINNSTEPRSQRRNPPCTPYLRRNK